MAALLNPILGTTFEETNYTRQMTNDMRSENTLELLLAILQVCNRGSVIFCSMPRVRSLLVIAAALAFCL